MKFTRTCASKTVGIAQYCIRASFRLIWPSLKRTVRDVSVQATAGYTCDFMWTNGKLYSNHIRAPNKHAPPGRGKKNRGQQLGAVARCCRDLQPMHRRTALPVRRRVTFKVESVDGGEYDHLCKKCHYCRRHTHRIHDDAPQRKHHDHQHNMTVHQKPEPKQACGYSIAAQNRTAFTRKLVPATSKAKTRISATWAFFSHPVPCHIV